MTTTNSPLHKPMTRAAPSMIPMEAGILPPAARYSVATTLEKATWDPTDISFAPLTSTKVIPTAQTR